jgi:hypothetical protein
VVTPHSRKAGNPHMATSHVPAFLDFRTWVLATCALSRNSASSCQQLARIPQMCAIARPRVCSQKTGKTRSWVNSLCFSAFALVL